jgi:hypothetical protein
VDSLEWHEENRWHFQAPSVDPNAELTLALLEDLNNLLVVHGYPPLRGYPLAEVAGAVVRLRDSG